LLITLTRDSQQPQGSLCTLGTIEANGRKFATMERPWVPSAIGPAGEPFKSCIASGVYRLEPRETDARGKHFILSNPTIGVYRLPQDIPKGRYGRALCLIHVANWPHELEGCIAPGKFRIPPRATGNPFDEWMVSESKVALNELRTLLGNGYDHQLQIV
jgi:hypothetical protein